MLYQLFEADDRMVICCTLTEVFLYSDWGFSVLWLRFLLTWMRFSLHWLRFFRAFFLSCNADVRLKLAKTGHGPHSSTLVVICVVWSLFMLFYVLFVCKCILLPGDNLIADNEYIITDKNECSVGANFCKLLLSQLHCCRRERKSSKWNEL